MNPVRTEEFKRAAVKKFHSRGSRSVKDLAKELGVPVSSFYKWSTDYATSGVMNTPDRRPQDLSAAEKLKSVIEFESLAADKRGEYLRSHGLHSEHIEAWKLSMQASLEPGVNSKVYRGEMNELKAENKELKRDLHRKDKALAEAAALLVLKKKADLIWGTGESE